jgi:SAM-dependent methyltransferase
VHVRAFDDLAAGYDATFTDTALGRALRDLVWLRLDDGFASCERVLDLGCGTGEDALRLARRGTRVVGIDASARMVHLARQKALAAGCATQIDFHCVSMENLRTVLDGESFDGVLSNFGAVNCARDLRALIADVAARLAPTGRLLWVMLGRHVPWEWLWYGMRGELRRAWRRLPRGGADWRGLTVCYPTPAEMRRLLSPWFAVSRVSPLGFALPPSFAGPWLERSPHVLRLLRGMEAAVQDCSALAALSDHYIIEALRLSA